MEWWVTKCICHVENTSESIELQMEESATIAMLKMKLRAEINKNAKKTKNNNMKNDNNNNNNKAMTTNNKKRNKTNTKKKNNTKKKIICKSWIKIIMFQNDQKFPNRFPKRMNINIIIL